MSAQATVQAGAAGAARRGFRLRRRHLWWIPGLAIAIYANELGKQHGLGITELLAIGVGFGIAPHLPLLLRYIGSRGSRPASLSILLFNLLHHPLAAVGAFAITAAGAVNEVIPIPALVASLVWLSHIVIGWGVGDGMRRPEVRR